MIVNAALHSLQLSEFLRSRAELFHSVMEDKKQIFKTIMTKFEEWGIISVSGGV